MDTIRWRIAVMLIASFVVGCTTPAGGRWPQEGVVSPKNAPPSASMVRSTDTLTLSLVTEREKYVIGEPVYAVIKLANKSQRVQRVIGSLHPEDGAVDVVITTPSGHREFVPLGEADHDATIFIELKPNEIIGNVTPIFFGGNGWSFSEPGRHIITAYYRLPGKKGVVYETKSQPSVIEIQPSEEGNSLVRERGPLSVEVGKFLTWQSGDHLEKGQSRLRDVIDQFPTSVLASYAHFAFARSLSDGFMNYDKREVRPPNCKLSLQHLSKMRDDQVTEYVRLQSAITAARCTVREKKADAARYHISIAKQIMDNRPEYRALSTRVYQLDKYVNESLQGPK